MYSQQQTNTSISMIWYVPTDSNQVWEKLFIQMFAKTQNNHVAFLKLCAYTIKIYTRP